MKFRSGQECAKCDQTAAPSKRTGDFITLSAFYHYILLRCL